MSVPRLYLDHNATAPLHAAAAHAMRAAMERVGNPASLHAEGRAARAVVEDARRAVASSLGGKAENLVFTSGGTEAAATLLSLEWAVRGERRICSELIVLATEHACVLSGGRFDAAAIHRAPVNAQGLVDLGALGSLLARCPAPLLAIQHANSETGVIQPMAEIVALARSHSALIVSDAVQSLGKIDVSIDALGVDALFVSAHKIGGPKGIGAILLADARVAPATPLIAGGGQQKGFRAGTESPMLTAGFGAVAKELIAIRSGFANAAALRGRFEAWLSHAAPEAVVFGSGAPRLPNTSLFALPEAPAETSLIAYDLEGLALSSGSACSSGKVKRSHVLDAMGIEPGMAQGAIRVSFGPDNTMTDVDRLIAAVTNRISALARKHIQPAAAAA